MKKLVKNLLAAVIVSLIFNSAVFAADAAGAAFVEGCKAYSAGDWSSAIFLLRKAAAYPENDNPDTMYMLISAEMSGDDEKSALYDCDTFLQDFPNSIYVPRIRFLKGKNLYSLGEYEKAIVVLGDFCHEYPDHELYPSALFYIAESLYAGYKYDEAETIYESIVTGYPESEKVSAAQYRIESIAQRSREEKLLYLLKQTGEEYLAAKEDYERQLKLYNSEAINTTREKLNDAQAKNKDLEQQIKDLEDQIAVLKADIAKRDEEKLKVADEPVVAQQVSDNNDDAVRQLKQKALIIQQLMKSKE